MNGCNLPIQSKQKVFQQGLYIYSIKRKLKNYKFVNLFKMDLDQQTLAQRIKDFLASNSQFRNPKFDPAPFLIQILKQKQSDHDAILLRRQDLIEMENQAFDLIDQVCSQYSDDFLKLLEVPQKQGEQLQKLRSNMSMVKKKSKQTKSLLMNTQKDIDQTYLNCMFNKIVYKKIKQVELKLHQYKSASLALKNNQFLNCSMNLPTFEGHSILQSALAKKAENLRLQLLSRGIQQVSLFLYLTPKIVLPTSQSLIQRVSSEESIFGNLKKHDGFHKRYNLFKKADCLEYLPTIWNFKQLQIKKGKIHLMYDIIKGALNIGKIQEILESLEIDCKKSINSIFLLLKFYFSLEVEEEKRKITETGKNNFFGKDSQDGWFLCQKGTSYIRFTSVVLNVMGVMVRKLVILLVILKEFQISGQQLSNLECYNFFELILKKLNQLIQSIFIKQENENLDYIHEQILKKIKSPNNYIHWANIRNIVINSLIIIDENLSMIDSQHKLAKKTISKPKWNEIVKIEEFDQKFFKKFHLEFMKTLEEIFNHEGKPFSFEPFEQIYSSRSMNQSQVSFCKYFSADEMKYSKEYIYTISLFGEIERFFTHSNLEESRSKKYQLYLLSVFYLKLNYYLQRFFISSKTLQKSYHLRKTNSKLKTKEKDFKRQFDKICLKRKFQVSIKPWKKATNEEVEQSKYRMVENLKGIEKQNEMLLSYCAKNLKDIEKYRDSENAITQIAVFDRLEPANYDENFNSKLIRIWDQLPEIETSINELTLSLLQKLMELHLVVVSVVYMQSQAD